MELEVTCIGPAGVAVAQAALYGVPVRAWTHREGGLVALYVPGEYENEVLRWYAAYDGTPGDAVGFARRVRP